MVHILLLTEGHGVPDIEPPLTAMNVHFECDGSRVWFRTVLESHTVHMLIPHTN
jgi:hypothetical protein